MPNPSPTNQWHARSVDLLETAGWINTADSQAPSMSEMLGVLGNLTALHLLTDYRNGPETPSYDNVILSGPALTGDLDADGFVGISDLNIVLGNWNQTVPPADPRADPSGDNFVGIEDLNTVLGNWNAGTPPVENTNIPEPGTAAIIGIGLSALLRRRGGR